MPPIATTLTAVPEGYQVLSKFGRLSGSGIDILTALSDLITKSENTFPTANCILGVSFSEIQYGDSEECVATGFACTLDPDPSQNQAGFTH